VRAAFGFYVVGAGLIFAGMAGLNLIGAPAWATVPVGSVIFILGIVVEERSFKGHSWGVPEAAPKG